MKIISAIRIKKALVKFGTAGMFAALTFLNPGNEAQAQTVQQDKPVMRLNRLGVGVRINHFYDMGFKPNEILESGFIGEDLQGLNGSKTQVDVGYGIDLIYFFSPLFSIDASYDRGSMTGAAKLDYYTSDVEFFTIGGNLALKRSLRKKPYKFVPYMRASLGQANYDASRKFKEDDSEFNAETGQCFQVGVGMGMRYHITSNVHLNLESNFITCYTDAWDGYDYARGYDYIVRTSLGVRYTFGRGEHVDKTLAWQDNRVDDLVAVNNTEINKSLNALSDSLRMMREAMAQMRNELNDRIAYENADIDKDGVLNRNDVCPDQFGPAYNNGCPDTSKTSLKQSAANPGPKQVARPAQAKATSGGSANVNLNEVKKMLLIEMNNIRFPSGKATLDEEALDILNRTAVIMKNNPGFKLVVLGYTDEEGSDNLNMKLSKLRASAVANYLVKQGVSRDQVEARPMGEQNPVDTSKSKRSKANNRRVEFLVEYIN